MNFLQPSLLFGLAAVAVPVAIHLINKLRVRDTQWAAMRFLEETAQAARNKLRWQDLLLLLARCLLFAALALAVARPVRESLVAGDGFPSGPLAAVILLDNSASMGQSNGTETRFDAAKKAARTYVDGLRQGSLVALSVVSNRSEALIAKPTGDFAVFRRTLELAPLSTRGGDLAGGIRAALQTLQPLTGRTKEIVIFTDGQAAAWKRLEEIRALAKENPEVRFRPVILGERGEENLAVTALRPDGSIPAVSQPARFRVDVVNFGTQKAEGVRVTLSADGGAPSDETLIERIEPGATRSVTLFARFATPGAHGVTAQIPPDRLAFDNERSAVVTVARQRTALILEGSPATAAKADRDGYFLANALAPVAREKLSQYYLKITSAPFGSLTKEKLAGNDFLFLCNPGEPSPQQAEALRDYVRDGGRLVHFPGPRTDPAKWNGLPALAELLPATLQPRATPAEPLAWQRGGYTHAVTALWNDAAQGSLGGVRMGTYFPLEPSPTGRPSVLLRYANNTPAAMEKTLGKGRVILFASTATPQWNNFPLHPAFVPFLQRLLGYLDPHRAAKLVLEPGGRFEAPVAMEFLGRDFSVTTPGNPAPRIAGKVEAEEGHAIVRFPDTETPGVYRLSVGDEPLAAFAVQTDPAESDLRQADRTAVEALARASEAAPAQTAAEKEAAQKQRKITQEYWTPLLWLAAALALVEMFMAHRFTPDRSNP